MAHFQMDLYLKIKEQRSGIIAPVDLLGCAVVPEEVPASERPFYILVALLLSSQTKDEITNDAVKKLRKSLGTLTPDTVRNAPESVLHEAIQKVGFHNRKLLYLQNISKILSTTRLPRSLEETLRLPGVGKKMAHLYLQHAWNTTCGIGVDTHVHRIANRIGLVSSSTPEKTRLALENAFPLSEWKEINSVLVGFGQSICLSVKPKCNDCNISSECPYKQDRLNTNKPK